MRTAFFIILSSFLFLGCNKKSNEAYLNEGLRGYKKFRHVHDELIKDYGVQKIAFFREADQFQYVILLADNVSAETVGKYSLGLQVYAKDKEFLGDKKFLMWDTKPFLLQKGKNKYVIEGFKQPIRELDSLVFFIYDRERYQGVVGSTISIKNIDL